ncbi:aldehyde dehydrogenase family protein, partial [Pseudomonas aeruginosa]|uniref:aldehyde dehydrogenase family protein n=1 Tax=Pseudomonas aeruginosa TaxID=287 RepID=UPI0024B6BF5A
TLAPSATPLSIIPSTRSCCLAEGASVVCGGARQGETGFYVQPTILADVTPGMQVVREEIFGPVLVATPFDDLDEAVRLAND